MGGIPTISGTSDPLSAIDIFQHREYLVIGTYGGGIVTCAKDMSGCRQDLLEEPDRDNPLQANVIQDLHRINDSIFIFASNRGPGVYHWPSGQFALFNISVWCGR